MSAIVLAPLSIIFAKSTMSIDGTLSKGLNCTAVIIGSKKLLTAKHCTAGSADAIFMIRYGTHLNPFGVKNKHTDTGGATIVRQHEKTGLMILEVAQDLPNGYQPVKIHSTKLKPGAIVYPVGFGIRTKPSESGPQNEELLN